LAVVKARIFWSVDGKNVEEEIIKANVIREVAPYETGEKGEWGVNPDSIKKIALKE